MIFIDDYIKLHMPRAGNCIRLLTIASIAMYCFIFGWSMMSM
jgi:hypothetical protein